MSARIVVELNEGRQLLIGGAGGDTGLGEVSFGDDVMRVGKDKFQGALGALGDLVAILEKSVGDMVNRPEKVELEFGASLTGKCDLWIVSGTGESAFKVKLTWEKK